MCRRRSSVSREESFIRTRNLPSGVDTLGGRRVLVRALRHLMALQAGIWLTVAPAAVAANDFPPIPQYGNARHLGVATCASATCHGAAIPAPGGVVLQNEYTTWQTHDKHAGAYYLLLNAQSERIARKLDLDAAHTADVCLDCHADNVPEVKRGARFQITDGVGCEACHGGAENWIQVHTINANETSHQRNIDAGLYPTADPVTRAELCLSCHLGDETKFATHRLMGAGHPRLSFELDTFTAIQPPHFVIDDDYQARKPVASGTKTWAIGQAKSLASLLEVVLDSEHRGAGLFPELALFDCHACHRPMSAGRWQERASLGLGPGVVRFNDANLIMLRVAAGVVSPRLAQEVRQQGRALHQASQASAPEWRAAARALHETSLQAIDVFAQHVFDQADCSALLDNLITEGERGEYIVYVAAEQTTMAIGAILTTMREAGWMGDAEFARIEEAMAEMYEAVQEDEQYRPSAHLDALQRLEASTR